MHRITYFGNGINEICDIFIKKYKCGTTARVKFNAITDLELSLWVAGGDGHDVTDQFFVLY